jgi:hypothetical protein
MNATDHGRKTEFVCPTCLFAVYARDTDPTPRCPRCQIRMEADDDLPQPRQPRPATRPPGPRPGHPPLHRKAKAAAGAS